jgi:hypothetical protein
LGHAQTSGRLGRGAKWRGATRRRAASASPYYHTQSLLGFRKDAAHSRNRNSGAAQVTRAVFSFFFLRRSVELKQGAPKKKKKNDVPTYLPFFEVFEIFRSHLENIFRVFLGSSCRETAKNAMKKKSMRKDDRKKDFFPQLFRPEAFDMDFPQRVLYGVFELPLLRNPQKRHKTTLKN